jgi:hypothetical protein
VLFSELSGLAYLKGAAQQAVRVKDVENISSMIVFPVSVITYGSGKAVSGMLAREFLRRNSVMMS